MLIAYLDESQRDGCYIIGSAVASQRTWETAAERLSVLRSHVSQEYSLPPQIEFHGHPLMQSTGDWKPLSGKHREKATIFLKALSVMDGLDISFTFRGVDTVHQRATYKNPWPPHEICMVFTLETLNDFARDQGNDDVIIVCDETSYEKRVRTRFEQDQKNGTFGFRRSKLERINAPLNFCSSANTDELQLIDLALYIWQRSKAAKRNENPLAKKTRERLLSKIEDRIIRGEIWRPRRKTAAPKVERPC